MSELDDAKARGLIFDYLQLQAKINHIEAEQAILKMELNGIMTRLGVTQLGGTDGVARIVEKHKYSFDVPAILRVVPAVAAKLKLSNEDFNKLLVGNEIALAPCRKVVETTQSMTISAAKPKK